MPKKRNHETLVERSGSLVAPPEWLQPTAKPDGFSNVEPGMIRMPRLDLMQGLSPQVVDGKRNAGELVNSLTDEIVRMPVEFVPIDFQLRRLMFVKGSRREVECASDDGKHAALRFGGGSCAECEFALWSEEGDDHEDRKPKCTMFYMFPILLEGSNNLIMLSLSRTKVKVAQRLLALARFLGGGGLPIYAGRYELATVGEKNEFGAFYNFSVRPVGWIDKETLSICKTLHDMIRQRGVEVELEGETSPEAGTSQEGEEVREDLPF